MRHNWDAAIIANISTNEWKTAISLGEGYYGMGELVILFPIRLHFRPPSGKMNDNEGGSMGKGKKNRLFLFLYIIPFFLLFLTVKEGMNKDGIGPSSWFIKERRRKKTGKERKVENESFSADIHDAFCSFMLRCSSLFHLSKSLRNKNEAKLLRYSYSFLLSFIQPRDLHSHTSDEMWRRHRLRCSVSYNATLTQNNNNPQVWVSRARTDLKRKHN